MKTERFPYHAKSGMLSQQVTTFMHCTTHTDTRPHVVEWTRLIDQVALSPRFSSGAALAILGKRGVVAR